MRTQQGDQRLAQACTGERRCDEAEGGFVARLPVPSMEVHQAYVRRRQPGRSQKSRGRFAVAMSSVLSGAAAQAAALQASNCGISVAKPAALALNGTGTGSLAWMGAAAVEGWHPSYGPEQAQTMQVLLSKTIAASARRTCATANLMHKTAL